MNKTIVTNGSALAKKYGSRSKDVDTAISHLIAADGARGITTQVVHLDDAAEMAALGGAAVASPADEKGAKDGVDAICTTGTPDYLVILGAGDVVPFISLANPMPSDGDANVPSDLPYACTKPYSTAISDFVAPTRVVGRIPDIVSGTSPDYVIGLLEASAAYVPPGKTKYASYFGLSASVWMVSTQLSLVAVFGASAGLNSSPPAPVGAWKATDLAPLAHFINCHGATADTHFYGQAGTAYPIAMDAAGLPGLIQNGTVGAMECCYGAELFDLALTAGQMPICMEYLKEGAFGFLGSTNIAYGPASSSGAADLICQYFLQDYIGGASLGRALLQARIKYAKGPGPLTAVDLKTLGQFYLLGDPSIHADAANVADAATAPELTAKAFSVRQAISSEASSIEGDIQFAVRIPDGLESKGIAPTNGGIPDLEVIETASYALSTHTAQPKLMGLEAMPQLVAHHRIILGRMRENQQQLVAVVEIPSEQGVSRSVFYSR